MAYTSTMHPIANPETIQTGIKHLQQADSVLAELIQQHPLCALQPHANYYQELVESIIGQQLSVKAAATILRRFVMLFGGDFPTPQQILEKSPDELRSAGLSNAKVRYIQDLALHIVGGNVHFIDFEHMDNQAIIGELTEVKGIGEWTAHMFLIFCMGRLDILATGDLGIRTGIQQQYKLPKLPTPQEVHAVAQANRWAPYQSIACWYIWRSLDQK